MGGFFLLLVGSSSLRERRSMLYGFLKAPFLSAVTSGKFLHEDELQWFRAIGSVLTVRTKRPCPTLLGVKPANIRSPCMITAYYENDPKMAHKQNIG